MAPVVATMEEELELLELGGEVGQGSGSEGGLLVCSDEAGDGYL